MALLIHTYDERPIKRSNWKGKIGSEEPQENSFYWQGNGDCKTFQDAEALNDRWSGNLLWLSCNNRSKQKKSFSEKVRSTSSHICYRSGNLFTSFSFVCRWFFSFHEIRKASVIKDWRAVKTWLSSSTILRKKVI